MGLLFEPIYYFLAATAIPSRITILDNCLYVLFQSKHSVFMLKIDFKNKSLSMVLKEGIQTKF